jgi:RimJ/RimL family protein N-acetyltransferase
VEYPGQTEGHVENGALRGAFFVCAEGDMEDDMIAPGPTLETARLILRPTATEDIQPWAAMMADEETARYIGGVQGPSVAWRGVMSMAGSWTLLGYGMFSVIEKSSGDWIGRIGPWVPEGWPGTEVGWSLIRSTWGRGYAPEAAAATIDWVFDVLGWTEVIHTIDADNVGSKQVAKKLGSTLLREDRLPPPYDAKPIDVWGQSRDQWRARAR